MSKRAVNIAILPPKEITDLAIRYNERIREDEQKIVLDEEHVLPHITLAMGCIENARIGELGQALEMVTERFTPLSLHITSFDGAQLHIDPTENIQNLHESVMDAAQPLIDQEIDESMVGPPPNPAGVFPGIDFTVNFVYSFKEKKAYENYDPHITCGFPASVPFEDLNIGFTAERLAICQLGGYCTCHDILWETTI